MNKSKIIELSKLFFLPYQIGFVKSHSYLSKNQVLEIKKNLNFDNKNIRKKYEQKMTHLIGHGYGISFASGRMAFYTVMKVLNIRKGDEIILPGFTCSVMPNAIWRTGATPIFSDIDKCTFGSSAKEIEKKITHRTKMIVAQHSFGIPCDIHPIIELGKKYNIFIFEDSAIALDSSIDGVKVGNWGDAAMFSTDHSKPLNTIIGGFLYTKNKYLYEKANEISMNLPQLNNMHQNRLYNRFITERKNYIPTRYPRFVIKESIKNYISKYRSFTFLEEDYKKPDSSNTSYPYPSKMPSFLSHIGLFEIEKWNEEKKKRKNLLNDYLDIIERSNFDGYLPDAYFDHSINIIPHRFVYTHKNAKKILKDMSKFIDIGWTWFRSPIVCSPDGPESLGYHFGSCQKSEDVCNNIINWPCALHDGWHEKITKLFKKHCIDLQLRDDKM